MGSREKKTLRDSISRFPFPFFRHLLQRSPSLSVFFLLFWLRVLQKKRENHAVLICNNKQKSEKENNKNKNNARVRARKGATAARDVKA